MGQSVVTAYVWSLVVFVIFFLVTILLSNMIPYKPNDRGAGTRRTIFWVFAALTFAVSFLINIAVASGIAIASQKEKYIDNSIIGAGAALVLFIILGLVISKACSKTKVGTWFN